MASMYKCPNLGNCDKADHREIIRLPVGSPAVCPECGSSLIPVGGNGGGKPPAWLPVAVIVSVLALVGLGAWQLIPKSKDCPNGESFNAMTNGCEKQKIAVVCKPDEILDQSTQTCIAPPPAREKQTLLRFHGSNTIGGKLLPALAEAFLKQEGYDKIRKVPGPKEDEGFVVGEKNYQEGQIEIQAHGSKTAFEDLKNGLCDIGMASRPIKPEERQALLPVLGDLSSNAGEHVLALDGIAIIVHPANPIGTLSVAQVADVFGGVITDWAQLGGPPGAITLYARNKNSGTFDHFKDDVLKPRGKELPALPDTQRFEDSGKLAAAVAADPAGIGFVGFAYVGPSKVLSLSDAGVEARKPNVSTIKTEDYRLSRRLYLYTAENPANPNVFKFIKFALDLKSGQKIVRDMDFVDLNPIGLA